LVILFVSQSASYADLFQRNPITAHTFRDVGLSIDRERDGVPLDDVYFKCGFFNVEQPSRVTDRAQLYLKTGFRWAMTAPMALYSGYVGWGIEMVSLMNSFDFDGFIGAEGVSCGNSFGDTPLVQPMYSFNFVYHLQ